MADMRAELLRTLRRRCTDRPSSGLWVLWLVLCLMLAQHAGLVHRIQHGGSPAAPMSAGRASPMAPATAATVRADTSLANTGTGADTVADSHASDNARAPTHSCVLFDAATQAPGACGAPPMPLLSHGKPLVPPGITWRWPHLPPQRSFLTRAPPASLAFA